MFSGDLRVPLPDSRCSQQKWGSLLKPFIRVAD